MMSSHRSVNDYQTRDALRNALLEGTLYDCCCDVATSAGEEEVVLDASKGSLASGEVASIPTKDAETSTVITRASSVCEEEDQRDWTINVVDEQTTNEQTLSNEIERLMVLKSYMLLDTSPVQFTQITSMAKRVFGVPISVCSLIDLGRQYFLGKCGLDISETPRKIGFCSQTVLSKEEVFIIPDAKLDFRFKDNPFTRGENGVRMYAGAPLISPEGYRLGALCIVDTKPWPQGLTGEQKELLKDMAKMAIEAMETHRTVQRLRTELGSSSKTVASAAHDLVTPLTGIQLSLSLLSGDSALQSTLQDHQKEILGTVSSCADVMSEICEGLRRKSSDDTGSAAGISSAIEVDASLVISQEPSARAFDVRQLAERVHQVMAAIPKNVPLSVTVASSVPSVIVADEISLFRASLNLLSSCCERTEHGFIHMNIRITDSGSPKSELVFECEDSGPTVDVSDQKRLMEASADNPDEWREFVSCGNASKWSVSNLANFVSLVRSLNGRIQLSSGECGASKRAITRFSFSVPLNVASLKREHCQLSLQDVSDIAKSGTSSPRIRTALVIDDSIVVRKTLVRALSQLGFETSQAADGMEGLQSMQKSTFDLVLCDFLMPVMDGMDTVREYRQWEKKHRPGFHQYIVGISAHASGKDAQKGLDIGMNDYRSKPVTLEDLKKLQTSAALAASSVALNEREAASLMGEGLESGSKRRRLVNSPENSSEKACLVAADSVLTPQIVEVVTSRGWTVDTACHGQDALHLLKARNYDVVVLDDKLPGVCGLECVEKFRTWEQESRIHRQRNIYLMSQGHVSAASNQGTGTLALVHLPTGVDGLLGKPLKRTELELLLANTELASTFDADDILTR